MIALHCKDCPEFMSLRLKFTTWMCQLTRQMSQYQAIDHTQVILSLVNHLHNTLSLVINTFIGDSVKAI